MAGLLEEYGIDLTEVEAPSYDVPDDIYEFVVGDVYVQAGTSNHPNESWICIQYQLGDSGKSKTEWFKLPQDMSDPTPDELKKLGYYKARLFNLGVAEEDLNSVGRDELIGLAGTLQVFTRNGFQNIKNVKLSEVNEFVPQTSPVAAPKTRRVAKATVPAAVAEAVAEEATPVAPKAKPAARAVAPRAAAAGVRKNPFAPK